MKSTLSYQGQRTLYHELETEWESDASERVNGQESGPVFLILGCSEPLWTVVLGKWFRWMEKNGRKGIYIEP